MSNRTAAHELVRPEAALALALLLPVLLAL
jgi:hypothetical protein